MMLEPWTPYADGTSGQQGGASADAELHRRSHIALALRFVSDSGLWGATWRDYAAYAGVHHGQASGALSNLHRSGSIMRLRDRRDRCGIYVTPANINGRATVEHRSNQKPDLLPDCEPPAPTPVRIDVEHVQRIIDAWLTIPWPKAPLAVTIVQALEGNN